MATLIGTNDPDILEGSASNDLIAGLGAEDAVIGDSGNNLLMGNDGGDLVTSLDELVTDRSTLSGGAGDDILVSSAGSDFLNGGTGDDYMQGGSGNDAYVVDSEGDVVVETSTTDPMDSVSSYMSYELPDNIENLTLLGIGDFTGTGNFKNNIITGNSGNNHLYGSPLTDRGGLQSVDTDSLIGGSGNDIYYVENSDDQIVEGANEGDDDQIFSYVTFQLPDNVETLHLAGTGSNVPEMDGTGNNQDNQLYGNQASNLLAGLDGNDTLHGGSGGLDVLLGGLGDDLYIVYDHNMDRVEESDLTGHDTTLSFEGEYTLTDNVENLTLGGPDDQGRVGAVGNGNELNNLIQGNEINNILRGNAGNDTLIGAQGADFLNGGTGSDTYIFNLGDGVDTVRDDDTPGPGDVDVVRFGDSIQQNQIAFFAYGDRLDFGYTGDSTDRIQVLNKNADNQPTQIERYELANGLFMDATDIRRTFTTMQTYARRNGIPFRNLDDVKKNPTLMAFINDSWRGGDNITTTFNPGNILIPGRFGTEFDDVMIGNYPPRAQFMGLIGDDLLIGTNFKAPAFEFGDYLNGGDSNDILNGLDGTDVLFGAAGNDVLNGGASFDDMAGYTGNDTYIVDVFNPNDPDHSDHVREAANQGRDTVETFVNYTLPVNVEILTLIGTAYYGRGNGLNNTLIGNDSNNELDGLSGIDIMRGKLGDDTYYVDNFDDQVEELSNQGYDRINSSASYDLPDNVEQLNLVGDLAIDGTGNALANILNGNLASNQLEGGEGDDILNGVYAPGIIDHLIGGTGSDTYIVEGNDTVTIDETPDEKEIDTAVVFGPSFILPDYVDNLILSVGSPPLPPIAKDGTGNAQANFMQGNQADNSLSGEANNDLLVGAEGNDTLNGGTGNDIYQFRREDGQDTVQDNGLATDIDTIRFTNSISQDNLAFAFTESGDLQIGDLVTDDVITVRGQTSSTSQIESFKVQDGLTLTAEDVSNVWTMLQTYAVQNHIIQPDAPFTLTLGMIEGNVDMMSIINGAWHA